ncbi:hypothetical protein QA640_13460 [Bradyrhizobium sp. CB82]|uniref:hypothetical protein n=1 Tax=Bradyrhizobium sp. CB82 TaxID=3039159 RepID=UPI0024B04A7D|nr:hypothetical protein [Bradyrhizobium sp. CB82]WFU43362.1 hypothetical protein QA640_13460 [Bradyrhizobium sp. CB82]
MSSKHLLALTLLLPFLTMPSFAYAAQTYSHWQNSARLAQQRVPNARAEALPLVADPYRTWSLTICTYQGGPKANSWVCR